MGRRRLHSGGTAALALALALTSCGAPSIDEGHGSAIIHTPDPTTHASTSTSEPAPPAPPRNDGVGNRERTESSEVPTSPGDLSHPAPAERASPLAPEAEPPSASSASEAESPSGWRSVYFDDFDRRTLGSGWAAYSGQPSSDPRARWDPSKVSLSNGALVLSGSQQPGTSQWLTGGVSNWRQARTYGKWEIRFRAPASDVLSYHFLLWPQSERWPPEIDIAEGFDEDRRRSEAFVHWIDDDGNRQRDNFSATSDFRSWRTVAVEWTPESITFLLDGVEYGRVAGDAVPHEPMFIALQTETQVSDAADHTSAGPHRVEVDWVRISAEAPPPAVPPSCASLFTAQQMYAYQPLYARVASRAPNSGGIARVLSDGGRACAWQHETNASTFEIAAVGLTSETLSARESEFAGSRTPVTLAISGRSVRTYLAGTRAQPEVHAFVNGLWIVVRADYFLSTSDATVPLTGVVNNLLR